MSYRNKTYVAFASEDIRSYRLMEAWRENENIDFHFHDAHDLATALDTSLPETIRRRLRERLSNTKQVVLLGSSTCKSKARRPASFLYYEVQVIQEFDLPVVVANLGGDRNINKDFIPDALLNSAYYTVSVSFQPSIIRYALDGYVPAYKAPQRPVGSHYYEAGIYRKLGL